MPVPVCASPCRRELSACKPVLLAMLMIVLAGLPLHGQRTANFKIPTPLVLPDQNGQFSTISTTGFIDLTNPFFQELGVNGRTCASCHSPTDGWSVTPRSLAIRFLLTGGNDPIFRPVDGANCPSADVSTVAARISAYSLLLKKGLIRMTLGVPVASEFSIVDIQDPQSCPQTVANTPALYRRPLPATNLVFLADVMWDGRQRKPGQSLNDSLAGQASAATFIHAEATRPPTQDQLAAIVAFQTGLFTAQHRDRAAGLLTAQNARGGARNLSQQPFFPGINDPDNNPTGAAFDPSVFNIYRSWEKLKGKGGVAAARQSVARGEILFNMFPIAVTGVAGMNDLPGKGTVVTTCSGCHTTPNVGNHSSTQLLNIGTSDYPARPGLDISGLPVYTLQCNTVSPPSSVQSTDPGLAMITGRCADISKIKNPILRGLAARAPYFHNGSAATLNDVVNFYDRRFNMNLDLQQKTDLAAFLSTL